MAARRPRSATSRLIPQIQIFFVTQPLTILIGIVVLLATIGTMMAAFLTDLGRFLEGFGTV